MGDVNELQKKGTKTMANLPGSIKNLNTLLGEQLLEGGGSGGGGSSDFSIAEMTLINLQGEGTINPPEVVMIDSEVDYLHQATSKTKLSAGTYPFVLYKGQSRLWGFNDDYLNKDGYSTSGNIRYDAESESYIITGDFTYSVFTYSAPK